MPSLTERIDRELPQTQCRRCGYPACLPYARAVGRGEAIDKCPPGGEDLIRRLARLLGRPEPAPARGGGQPFAAAAIREDACIGCAKCIQACPVDAIVGAAGLAHTVLAAECSGCGLCLAPCPVDCIDMAERPGGREEEDARSGRSARWRRRFLLRRRRLKLERAARRRADAGGGFSRERARREIAAAVRRVERRRRAARQAGRLP